MKPRTLRRKLQKKLKHKPYRLCPACGQRMRMELTAVVSSGVVLGYRLFKTCMNYTKEYSNNGWSNPCPRYKVKVELFWSGGGILADTYP